MQVESSCCCFPRELHVVSCVHPGELMSFNPRHVTCSPPIRKRIWLGKYNKHNYLNHKDFYLLVPCSVSKTGQIPEEQDVSGMIAAPCWTEASWSRNVNKNDSLLLRHLRFITNFWSETLLVLIFSTSFTSEQIPSSVGCSFPFLYSSKTFIGRICPGAIAKALSWAVSFTESWRPEEDSFMVETFVTLSQWEPCKLLMGIDMNVENSLPSTRSGKYDGDKTSKVFFVSRSFMLQLNANDPLDLRRSCRVWIPRESGTDDLELNNNYYFFNNNHPGAYQ